MGPLNIDSYCCSFAKRHLRSLIEKFLYAYTHIHFVIKNFTNWRNALNFVLLREVTLFQSSYDNLPSQIYRSFVLKTNFFRISSFFPDSLFTYLHAHIRTFLLPLRLFFWIILHLGKYLFSQTYLYNSLERKIVCFSDNILIFIWLLI